MCKWQRMKEAHCAGLPERSRNLSNSHRVQSQATCAYSQAGLSAGEAWQGVRALDKAQV